MDNNQLDTRSHYLEHIAKQKISGLSIKKYCNLNNLVEHKFNYYRSYELKQNQSPKKKSFQKVIVRPVESKPATSDVDPVWLAKFINGLFVK